MVESAPIETEADITPLNDTNLDDRALIELIAQQRADALQILYRRYNRLVFSLAFNAVNDQQTAEELTLDVFMRIWEKAGTYQPQKAMVRSWLISIARYRVIDWLRQQKSSPDYVYLRWHESLAESSLINDNIEDGVLNRNVMRLALAQLPYEQQQALILAFYGGYSHRQLAELLEQPLGTIKTRIRLGMQKLRQILLEKV